MMNENEIEIGKILVDAAVAVHRELVPGLLESVYEVILAYELKKCGLSVNRQVSIPIEYQGIKFDKGWNLRVPFFPGDTFPSLTFKNILRSM